MNDKQINEMTSHQNKNIDNWLTQLNGKTVIKIYQVDYNKNRTQDIYLPWLFFFLFSDFEKFLELEGDFDGQHIKINFYDRSELDKKLKTNNLPDEPDLWSVYETNPEETLGQILGQKIMFVEYGIEKDKFEINGKIIKGEKDVYNFIRFNCEAVSLTIFEGLGLCVSTDKNIKLDFEETFEKYDTKNNNL